VDKSLPRPWQNFAMPVAKLCHACGKTLPCLWQNSATPVAKLCGIFQHTKKKGYFCALFLQ
jgi:hypothetical protein